MGLYRQPNDWSCGPFALKHALVTLGRLADEEIISDVAHPHWWSGTNEVQLARAARYFGCELPLVRKNDPDRAHKALIRHIKDELPVILCVDNWGHWLTVVANEGERFVVLDSRNEPVLKVIPWKRLRSRWQYVDYDEFDNPVFDLHPVRPTFRPPVKAHFSVQRARYLRRRENRHLAQYWDEYLEDIMEICRPRSGRFHEVLSMGEFLRRNQDLLVSRVTYWHGGIHASDVYRLLKNFRCVAETYGLVIPCSGQKRATVDMAMLLALWAASKGGVNELYGSEEECSVPPHRNRQRHR